jgi:hypothetical protein
LENGYCKIANTINNWNTKRQNMFHRWPSGVSSSLTSPAFLSWPLRRQQLQLAATTAALQVTCQTPDSASWLQVCASTERPLSCWSNLSISDRTLSSTVTDRCSTISLWARTGRDWWVREEMRTRPSSRRRPQRARRFRPTVISMLVREWANTIQGRKQKQKQKHF